VYISEGEKKRFLLIFALAGLVSSFVLHEAILGVFFSVFSLEVMFSLGSSWG